MAVSEVEVTQSVANAESRSAFYELVAQVNKLMDDMEGLLQQLDGDAGVNDTDYEANHENFKKLTFKETGAPTAS